MKDLPQLDREQLNEWREKILGENCNKFPHSFLFEQLFYECSPLSKGDLFSERTKILLRKFRNGNISEGLQQIFPDTLKFLRDNDYLDEETYHTEYDKCIDLISKKIRKPLSIYS
jgi:hypothetical protein